MLAWVSSVSSADIPAVMFAMLWLIRLVAVDLLHLEQTTSQGELQGAPCWVGVSACLDAI